MPTPDEALIHRFKKGDVSSFEKLFERYADRIHSFSYRMCRHLEDAQDVLQETFLSAFHHMNDFKGRAQLTTWLYKIASNACLKNRKGKEDDGKDHRECIFSAGAGGRRGELFGHNRRI